MTNQVRACVKCGAYQRYANGQCKACSKAAAAAWKAANPERHRATVAAWQAANPERAKEIDSRWKSANKARIKANDAANYLANSDREKANATAWQAANPEAVRVIHQNRRARKKASIGRLSKDLAKKLLALQKGMCPCCKRPLGDDYHMDHIMPLALGGSNTDENIQLLRKQCNSQKHATHPVDFMQIRGFLL